MRALRACWVMIALQLSLSAVYGHPGGLDKNGGHWDRKNGTYHHHRGGPSSGGVSGTTRPATSQRQQSQTPHYPIPAPTPDARPFLPSPPRPAASPTPDIKVPLKVVRVVDENCVLLIQPDGFITTVTLLGCLPPSVDQVKEEFWQKAAEFAGSLLRGEQVYIRELDTLNQPLAGRRRVILERVHDGLLINLEILKNGYAIADKSMEAPLRAKFLSAENEAMRGQRGLYSREFRR